MWLLSYCFAFVNATTNKFASAMACALAFDVKLLIIREDGERERERKKGIRKMELKLGK